MGMLVHPILHDLPSEEAQSPQPDVTEDRAPTGARAVVVLLMTAVLTWSPFRVGRSEVEGFSL